MNRPAFIVERILSLDKIKREYLRWILKLTRGNKAEAARLMQIDRSTMYRLLSSSRSREPGAPLCQPGASLCETGSEQCECRGRHALTKYSSCQCQCCRAHRGGTAGGGRLPTGTAGGGRLPRSG